MALVRPGGLLMTCSCSGAMTQSGEFISHLQVMPDGMSGQVAHLFRQRGSCVVCLSSCRGLRWMLLAAHIVYSPRDSYHAWFTALVSWTMHTVAPLPRS